MTIFSLDIYIFVENISDLLIRFLDRLSQCQWAFQWFVGRTFCTRPRRSFWDNSDKLEWMMFSYKDMWRRLEWTLEFTMLTLDIFLPKLGSQTFIVFLELWKWILEVWRANLLKRKNPVYFSYQFHSRHNSSL